tara:strand:- start:330 stop:914 length:585 start_codon:yes stop_codon:yes gene_type:complete
MLGLGNSITSLPYAQYSSGSYLLVECTDSSLTSGTNSILGFQNLTSSTRSDNDVLVTSFDYYLTDPDGVDGTDNVGVRVGQGGFGSGEFINGTAFNFIGLGQNGAFSFAQTSTCDGNNWTNNLLIVFTVFGDKPSFQTQFYISNLQVIHKNSGGTVLETITFDFSGSGDISMVTGTGAFAPGSSSYTKGNNIPG